MRGKASRGGGQGTALTHSPGKVRFETPPPQPHPGSAALPMAFSGWNPTREMIRTLQVKAVAEISQAGALLSFRIESGTEGNSNVFPRNVASMNCLHYCSALPLIMCFHGEPVANRFAMANNVTRAPASLPSCNDLIIKIKEREVMLPLSLDRKFHCRFLREGERERERERRMASDDWKRKQ